MDSEDLAFFQLTGSTTTHFPPSYSSSQITSYEYHYWVMNIRGFSCVVWLQFHLQRLNTCTNVGDNIVELARRWTILRFCAAFFPVS